MECGTECWGRRDSSGASPCSIPWQFPPGVEGLGLSWDRSCCCVHLEQGQGLGVVLGTVLTILEAHQSMGLELAGPFRVSLWDVCVLSPQFNLPICVINPEAGRGQLEVGLASLQGQHSISRSSLEDFLM